MGILKKATVEKKCDVSGCQEVAERSISTKKAKGILTLSVDKKERKAHLCKNHYKEFKKATKKDRTLDRLAWE
jgi:hypothetical protein